MFFVIWQGWGILSILIPVLCILPFHAVSLSAVGGDGGLFVVECALSVRHGPYASGVYFPSRRHPVNQGRSEIVVFTSLMTVLLQLHLSLSSTTQPSSLRERQVRDGPWPRSQEFELHGIAR